MIECRARNKIIITALQIKIQSKRKITRSKILYFIETNPIIEGEELGSTK